VGRRVRRGARWKRASVERDGRAARASSYRPERP
jgi:hypothetical protein